MKGYLKRSEANTPQKLILDSDDKKDYYLMVVSAHSDQYTLNRSVIRQKAAEAAIDGAFSDNHSRFHAQICSAAVVDWSVPKEHGEYSQENVEKLLYEYPQILESVDYFSSAATNFLEKK